MIDEVTLSWSQLTRWRQECYQRFGGIRNLDLCSPTKEIRALLRPDSCVLDIGAGVHKWLQQFVSLPSQGYYSLDIDPDGDFDFRSFEEIPANLQFDLMVANQVLEHVAISDAFAMLCSAYRHLVDGGRLLATVPSPSHPVRHWGDATHLQHWPMFDLYGLFRSAGFQVPALTRYNKFPLTRNPLKRMVVNVVCETFRVDWCDSLMIVGQKRLPDG
jgi:hypothetical protein